MNRQLGQDGVEMANKYMEKCSISIVIREFQIRTTGKYHYTPMTTKKEGRGEHAVHIAGKYCFLFLFVYCGKEHTA